MTQSAAPDGEMPNLGLLIKLLKMTTSNTDAEALSAIRKANEQLSKFGGDWEALLRGKVTVIGEDPFRDMPAPPVQESRSTRPTVPRRPVPQAPQRPTPTPPPQPSQAYTATRRAAQSTPKPAKPQIGPSGGRTRSNLYAGACIKCANHVPIDDGFSIKDTSWNTSSKWQVVCHPCFYRNAPAGYAPAKATVTSIDLDSLA